LKREGPKKEKEGNNFCESDMHSVSISATPNKGSCPIGDIGGNLSGFLAYEDMGKLTHIVVITITKPVRI
jgi:hypothetical protein